MFYSISKDSWKFIDNETCQKCAARKKCSQNIGCVQFTPNNYKASKFEYQSLCCLNDTEFCLVQSGHILFYYFQKDLKYTGKNKIVQSQTIQKALLMSKKAYLKLLG